MIETYGDHSAFPEVLEQPQFNFHTYGLTKREYFAAVAMQGLLSNPYYNGMMYEKVVNDAVAVANALIKALNENPDLLKQ